MPIALPRPRTQGQHDVVFDLVAPYEQFPRKVTGPTVWRAEDFRAKPELWKERWSDEQIADLERAYESFQGSGRPITAISKVGRKSRTASGLEIPLTAASLALLSSCTGHLPAIAQHHQILNRHSLSDRTRSRFHPHRRASSGELASGEIGSHLSGHRNVVWKHVESEWKGSCTRSCQGSRKRSHPDRQGQDLLVSKRRCQQQLHLLTLLRYTERQLDNFSIPTQPISLACSASTRPKREANRTSSRLTTYGTRCKRNDLMSRNC
jgi:hypothetical protein